MSKQINDYTKVRTALNVSDDDLMDLDSTDDGGTSYESAKMTVGQLMVKVQEFNFYNIDGTINGQRVVTGTGSANVRFDNASVSSRAAASDFTSFSVQNPLGSNMGSFIYSDITGTASLNLATPTATFFSVQKGKLIMGRSFGSTIAQTVVDIKGGVEIEAASSGGGVSDYPFKVSNTTKDLFVILNGGTSQFNDKLIIKDGDLTMTTTSTLSGTAALNIRNSAFDSLMWLGNDGKLGVNNFSPQAQLHVSSDALVGGKTLRVDAGGSNNTLFVGEDLSGGFCVVGDDDRINNARLSVSGNFSTSSVMSIGGAGVAGSALSMPSTYIISMGGAILGRAGGLTTYLDSAANNNIQFRNASNAVYVEMKQDAIQYTARAATSIGVQPPYLQTTRTSYWNGVVSIQRQTEIKHYTDNVSTVTYMDITLDNDVALRLGDGGRVIMPMLPTGTSGLVAGQLWNDSGTLKIF